MSIRIKIAAALAVAALLAFAAPAGAIVNGTTTAASSWPWAVQVVILDGGSVSGFCGGTLVAPQRVVTAGHCVSGEPASDVKVIANSKEFMDIDGLVDVAAYELAPSYAAGTATDVAVLTLATAPVPATPIQLLATSESGDYPAAAPALVAGWGSTTDAGGALSDTLRQGTVTLLSSGCGLAGVRCSTTATEPCAGDTGGPAIVQMGADTVGKDPSPSNGTWRLVAIPVAGDGECTQALYADLMQPEIRAFVAPEDAQPDDGGSPSTSPPTTGATALSPPPAQSPSAPPETRLLKAILVKEEGRATFRFKGIGATTGFRCALAKPGRKARFRSCRSPKAYKHLAPGSYTFKVRAIGPGGADATPAKKRFRIG